nr:reverse transcriptase domain-containing protein [Tanacetum cinerariifolium]
MHKAFSLPRESSYWQYKFPLPVEGVPTARRMEIPLPRVCTAMMKKMPVKENWEFFFSVSLIDSSSSKPSSTKSDVLEGGGVSSNVTLSNSLIFLNKFEDINQIDEDDIKEMGIKWNMALLSMRADKFWKRTRKKISIQGSDVAGFDKSKVECFNCHKMGHFARECRAPRNQERFLRTTILLPLCHVYSFIFYVIPCLYIRSLSVMLSRISFHVLYGRKESYRQGSKAEEKSSKALMDINKVGWDWSYMANEEDHALMVNTRTDAELAVAVQNALQTLLLQIRAEIRKEFRTSFGPQGGGDNHHSNNNYSGNNNKLNFKSIRSSSTHKYNDNITVSSSPGVPLRATPTRSVLCVDANTQESVVELLKPGASGRVFAITEDHATNTSDQKGRITLLRNSSNGDGSHSSHEDNRWNVQTARPCFYADFMKCQPLNFKETEGVVGLTRWIEKMESVFQISGCAIENPVKFATCTLLDAALTWWNSQIRSLGPDAYSMTWEVLKKNMTDKYCPQGKIKKLEIELWNLNVKENKVSAYTEHFQELTLICIKFVADEAEKIDKYVSRLPDNIYGSVKASKPK